MREIKFRAWEYNLKEMIEVDDIQFYRGDDIEVDGIKLKPRLRNEQPIIINTRSAWRIADGEDVTLMQYTGLKDKNGVEIYEGDILLTNDMYHDYVDGVAINALPDGKFVEVKWESGAFFTGDEMLLEISPYYEIIGNIYQNPELLDNNN